MLYPSVLAAVLCAAVRVRSPSCAPSSCGPAVGCAVGEEVVGQFVQFADRHRRREVRRKHYRRRVTNPKASPAKRPLLGGLMAGVFGQLGGQRRRRRRSTPPALCPRAIELGKLQVTTVRPEFWSVVDERVGAGSVDDDSAESVAARGQVLGAASTVLHRHLPRERDEGIERPAATVTRRPPTLLLCPIDRTHLGQVGDLGGGLQETDGCVRSAARRAPRRRSWGCHPPIFSVRTTDSLTLPVSSTSRHPGGQRRDEVDQTESDGAGPGP